MVEFLDKLIPATDRDLGADAEDLSLTIHAHPTLHESVGLSAEIFEDVITDLPNKKAGVTRASTVRA